jgi:hypothetical protein
MNKIYVIVPFVLMIAFGFYFRDFYAGHKATVALKEEAARLKAEEEKRFEQEQANLASLEAERRQKEKEIKDAADRAARKAEQDRIDSEVREAYESAMAEIARSTVELDELEAKLKETRLKRERTEAALLELAREVELTRIERRTAELDLQRAVGMLADRTEATALVNPSLFPTPQAPPSSR